jgi:hypothetical protein
MNKYKTNSLVFSFCVIMLHINLSISDNDNHQLINYFIIFLFSIRKIFSQMCFDHLLEFMSKIRNFNFIKCINHFKSK